MACRIEARVQMGQNSLHGGYRMEQGVYRVMGVQGPENIPYDSDNVRDPGARDPLVELSRYGGAGDYEYWWIYLTHWTLVVESMYFVSAAYTTWRAFTNKEQKLSADKHMILSWVLHDIAYPSTCLVMVMFWGLVFSPPIRALTTFTHGVNFIMMLVDVILSSQPYYIMHAAYFLIYSAVYIGWTLFFYAVKARNDDGDRYVYSALDYEDDLGGALVSIAIAFFFLIPLQLPLLWSVVHFRTRKANHTIQDNGDNQDDNEVEMANRITLQV
eukprot:CAMPEP_0198199704 /NCGR_PEP_ID=MMETSP1445-20131203/2907_1 /TAXON_ID=36898 /ORGANISM="Pyramimonas sp., Strain CCMP2087" /LENGTH=270 /DNA_ID=CAMNT_0043869593 /DNA_START=34 /DNA_END=847 /DNA_ORIENTATION=+